MALAAGAETGASYRHPPALALAAQVQEIASSSRGDAAGGKAGAAAVAPSAAPSILHCYSALTSSAPLRTSLAGDQGEHPASGSSSSSGATPNLPSTMAAILELLLQVREVSRF